MQTCLDDCTAFLTSAAAFLASNAAAAFASSTAAFCANSTRIRSKSRFTYFVTTELVDRYAPVDIYDHLSLQGRRGAKKDLRPQLIASASPFQRHPAHFGAWIRRHCPTSGRCILHVLQPLERRIAYTQSLGTLYGQSFGISYAHSERLHVIE